MKNRTCEITQNLTRIEIKEIVGEFEYTISGIFNTEKLYDFPMFEDVYKSYTWYDLVTYFCVTALDFNIESKYISKDIEGNTNE
jgi:hypothetical protein